MTTLEVLETLDWTDPTVRERYQQVIWEENAHALQYCFKSDGTSALVSIYDRKFLIEKLNVNAMKKTLTTFDIVRFSLLTYLNA